MAFSSYEVTQYDFVNVLFYKKCNQVANCKVEQKTGTLVAELKKEILSKAATYKKQNKDKNFKEYKGKGSAQ